MADLKISQLSSATALAGTEVVPVVQGGTTKKATIDQILAPAAGKGIDFSAAGGDTLSMYDEGTWTPSVTAGSGSITSYTATGTYTRVGRQVTLLLNIGLTNNGTGAGFLQVTGVPFTIGSNLAAVYGKNNNNGNNLGGVLAFTTLYLSKYDGTYPGTTGDTLLFTVTYFV